MGFYHARLLARLGYLDSIVDSNTQISRNTGEKFEIPWYSSLNAMIEERSPNGVIISVPTRIHSQTALEVVDKVAGLKALLIEKPVTSSVKEAIDLKKKLKQTKVKVVIGHIEIFNPVITRIQQILNQEIIGDLRSVLFQRRGAVAEERIESIGDCYQDIGVHDFDVASRILPKGKVRLFSSAVKVNREANSSIIILSSEKGNFQASFVMSREYAGKLRTIDIEGTKATLFANLLTQILELRSLEIARGEKDISAIRIPFSNGEQIKVYGEPLLHEILHFIDCIRNKTKPLVSIDDGMKALNLVEAARRSVKTGNVIHLEI